ncbi:MAG: sugar phosphate isomerase/epimerase family protein [Planctomycetaceae bacterium]
MFAIKRAAATRCLNLPIRRAITAAAKMGAEGIQLDVRHEVNARELSETGRRQFLHALGQYNLRLASTFLPTRGTLYDENNLDQRISAIRGAMEFSHQLGTDVLNVNIGPIPADDSPDRKTLLEVLSELAAHGNHVGTTLCLRSGSSTAEQLLALMGSVDTGPLAIDFDPASSIANGCDALADYSVLHKLVQHVRATDTAIASDNSSMEVPIGQGRVPWMELVIMLGEGKFNGWLTVERTSGLRRADDVQRGLEYLKPQLPV